MYVKNPGFIYLFVKQKIDAHGLGRVVASGDDKWKKGDLIAGLLGWEEYSLVKPWPEPNKIEFVDQFPLSFYLSVLGTSGHTAYAGLFQICKAKKGDKVFVSTAAGSVGNLVGQYAKLAGCYVVGCAGSKKKVDLLKEKLGFDDAFNYNEEPDVKSFLVSCLVIILTYILIFCPSPLSIFAMAECTHLKTSPMALRMFPQPL